MSSNRSFMQAGLSPWCALCGSAIHFAALERTESANMKVDSNTYFIVSRSPFFSGVNNYENGRYIPCNVLPHPEAGNNGSFVNRPGHDIPLHGHCWDFFKRQLPPSILDPSAIRGLHLLLLAINTPLLPSLPHYTYARLVPGVYGKSFRDSSLARKCAVSPERLFAITDNCPQDTWDPPVLSQDMELREPGTHDMFSLLPSEILCCLYEFLTLFDLCALRIASRTVAIRSRFRELQRGFWAAQFLGSGEYGFLKLPTEDNFMSTPTRDLIRGIYRISRASRYTHSSIAMTPGMIQCEKFSRDRWRRGVLCLASHTVHVLALYSKRLLQYKNAVAADNLIPDSVMACNSRQARTRKTELVCNPFEGLITLFDRDSQEKRATQVSGHFIPFFGLNMLCGLTVRRGEHVETLGLLNDILISTIEIPHDANITSLHVTATQEGIIGLRFFFDGSIPSCELTAGGCLDMYKASIGVSVLNPSQGGDLEGLYMKFDVFKFVGARLAIHQRHVQQKSASLNYEKLWHGTPPSTDRFSLNKMLPPPFSMWCYHMKIYDRETTSPSKVLSEITSLSIEETGALFGLILGFTDGTKNQYGGYFHWRLNAARDINITRNTVYFDTLQSEQIKSISYKLARSTDHCPVSVRRDNIFIVETKILTTKSRLIYLQKPVSSHLLQGRVRTLRGDSAPSTPGERVSAINAATGVAGAPFETLALESFKCSPE